MLILRLEVGRLSRITSAEDAPFTPVEVAQMLLGIILRVSIKYPYKQPLGVAKIWRRYSLGRGKARKFIDSPRRSSNCHPKVASRGIPSVRRLGCIASIRLEANGPVAATGAEHDTCALREQNLGSTISPGRR
jgi:hypothetical protein